MAMALENQLSFLEQGLAVDKARLDKLIRERNQIAALGEPTDYYDAEIESAQADVEAGIQDVLDKQQEISDQMDAEKGDTAEDSINNSDTDSDSEDLSEEEQSQVDENSGGADDPYANIEDTDLLPVQEPTTVIQEVVVTAKRLPKEEKKEIDPVPNRIARTNPLHQFSTYTYSIALFILSKADINLLSTNPDNWMPGATGNNCLIASGGKNAGAYKRNDHFKDDFYFDNLQMTTVIGLNSRSKATNAIDLSFTVIEPYGMSLLDRIMAAADQIKAPNFKAMPYLLEVDFYGYDDNGNVLKLSEQRKRFPIQIIELKIKMNTKGAEYAIKAIPWNHQALSQSASTTPINIEVAAATVAEFFAENEEDFQSIAKQDLAKMTASEDNGRIEKNTEEVKEVDASGRKTAATDPRVVNKTEPDKSARTPEQSKTLKENQAILAKAYAVKSFCGGVNGWFSDLTAKRLRAIPDKIYVEFHGSDKIPVEKIRDAKITVPSRKDISRSATTDAPPKAAAAASANPTNKTFSDAGAFPISAGTSIPHVIDMVMRNSSYITDQISDPKDTKPEEIAEKLEKPLYWYKIIPSIKTGEYDFSVNKFSTEITYHVVPYIVYDSKHPNGPVLAPQGSIKEYSYSYTGKNVDILDLQIDFDTMFYTAVTAGSAKWQADQLQKAKEQLDSAQNAAKSSSESARELVNRQLRLVSAQPQQQGLAGQQGSAEQILAGDIQKSQYSNSRGDMLNLKLKIVGDPELIKQDDIYTNPAQGGYAEQLANDIMPQNGSIPMDDGEVIAQVNFRTIVDMDETTGLPRQGVMADSSVFSGKYRMLTVSNVFQGGKFEQTVDMVRVPEPAPKKTNTTPPTKEENNTETAPGHGSRSVESGTTGDDLSSFYDFGEPAPEEPNPEPTFPEDDQDELQDETDAQTDEEQQLEAIDEDAEEVGADDWWDNGNEVALTPAQTDVIGIDENYA